MIQFLTLSHPISPVAKINIRQIILLIILLGIFTVAYITALNFYFNKACEIPHPLQGGDG